MRSKNVQARVRFGLVASCALAFGACRPSESAKNEGDARPDAAPLPRAVATSKNPSAPTLPPGDPVSFASELREMERLRGLTAKREVLGRTIATADLARHLESTFVHDVPEHARRGIGDAFVALGLAPRGFDYGASMIELMKTDLAGLYDPRFGAMFLRRELEGELRRVTLAHELVHALQDQHFDLKSVTTFQEDGSDRTSALSCLAEGDATSAMFDAILSAQGGTALDLPEAAFTAQFEAAALPKGEDDPVPSILRRSMIAPYADGLRFVHALRRRGGFDEVNRVFARPPTTTEQILHLESYDRSEVPGEVGLPKSPPGPPDEAFRLLFHDVWGEQSLRLVLEEWIPLDAAASAAEGWNGDRVAVFERRSERAFAWIIDMDSEEEATELGEAFARAMVARGGRVNGGRSGIPCSVRADLGPFVTTVGGLRVLLVAGPFDRERTTAAATSDAPGVTTVADACAAARAWAHTLWDVTGEGASPL